MSGEFDPGSEADFIRWNEDMAHKYNPEDYHLRSSFLIRWIERRRVESILRFLQPEERDSVLEVGCGAGNVLESVSLGQLHGVDLSVFLLGRSKVRLAHRQARLVRANAERLPYAGRIFDKLICTEVLEHVLRPRNVLIEMVRVAKQGAICVISIPNERWINRVKRGVRALGLRRWLLQGGGDSYHSPDCMTDEWHLHDFDLGLFEKMLPDVLHICQVEAVPFRLLPLRYVICCQVIGREAG